MQEIERDRRQGGFLVNVRILRECKGQAAKEGRSVGELIDDAMSLYLEQVKMKEVEKVKRPLKRTKQ
jgi:hypothetical protein